MMKSPVVESVFNDRVSLEASDYRQEGRWRRFVIMSLIVFGGVVSGYRRYFVG